MPDSITSNVDLIILKKQGLTLIELLLAITLFSVTAVVLYSVLHQGVLVWKRTETEDVSLREERIFIKKITDDIRNGFIHSWVRFMGKADEIYFCSLNRLPQEDISSELDRLIKMHYIFVETEHDNFKKGIYVSEYPIEQRFSEKPPPARKLTSIFKYLRLDYGYWDSDEEKIIYKKEWDEPEKFPRLIRLTWKTENHPERTRTLVHPLGELTQIKKKGSNEAENE